MIEKSQDINFQRERGVGLSKPTFQAVEAPDVHGGLGVSCPVQ